MNITLFTENIYKVSTILPHKKILNEIKKVEYNPVHPTVSYPEHKTNQYISANNLLDNIPTGSKIREVVDTIVSDAIKSFGYDCEFSLNTSWANKIYPQNRSEFHSHKNFWLSAVYYPHGEIKDKFTIVFKKNDLNYYDIRKKSDNSFNTNMCSVNVKEGDLIIFPSYLQHKIGYNDSKVVRYSIALNFLPTGTLGHKDGEIKSHAALYKKS